MNGAEYLVMNGVFSSRKDDISFIMSLLMRYIHLLHKYDRCHVTDTTLQLYMIVG